MHRKAIINGPDLILRCKIFPNFSEIQKVSVLQYWLNSLACIVLIVYMLEKSWIIRFMVKAWGEPLLNKRI